MRADASLAAVAAAAPVADPDAAPRAKAIVQPTIRVDLDRVDRLINLVGELVINQAIGAMCLPKMP